MQNDRHYASSKNSGVVHIVEKLQSPGSASSVWKSMSVSSSLDSDGQWVDVLVVEMTELGSIGL